MSERKNDRRRGDAAVAAAEKLVLARMEALEPREGGMGTPVEREVVFIRVREHPWRKLPVVMRHQEGYVVCVYGREIPEELAEEYLRQHPGAAFVEGGEGVKCNDK
jgi:hypothetical protein